MPPRLGVRSELIERLVSRQGLQHKRPICSLSQLSVRSSQPSPCTAPRVFSSSAFLSKKGGKSKGAAAASATEEPESAGVDDPQDFSSLSVGIDKTLEKLNADLSKLRTGGKFNPELLEDVRVHLVKGDKKSIRLGELAQVLPKGGRGLMVLVGEKDHVKPIISAIQGSRELNLQPQQDAQNASQLNIALPPPTKESRDAALAAASKTGDVAYVGIRNARGAMQKRLRAMELKKTVRPDDLKKAHKEMEKVVEKGNADVKKAVDAARKAMEQS